MIKTIINISLLLFLISGFFLGFKRGFIKQSFSFLGLLLIIGLSFCFKSVVFNFLINFLPFFNFIGKLKGVIILNLLVYELLAFFITLSVLLVVYRLILFATGVIEKVINFTVILAIPSKILGGLMGILEAYVYLFMILFIISLPFFNLKIVDNSTANIILTKTPFVTKIANNSVNTFNEINDLTKTFKKEKDSNKVNLEALDILLKYRITKVETVENLVEKDKIRINNIEKVLEKYREEL